VEVDVPEVVVQVVLPPVDQPVGAHVYLTVQRDVELPALVLVVQVVLMGVLYVQVVEEFVPQFVILPVLVHVLPVVTQTVSIVVIKLVPMDVGLTV
jgi:hypothetical protein